MSRRSNEHAVAALVLALLAMPITSIVYGATLAKLWEWFIADTFAVKALSTAEAIGVSLVVTFVTYQYDAKAKDDESDALGNVVGIIVFGFCRALFVLAVAAVVKGFV